MAARLARKALADTRAMEEEAERKNPLRKGGVPTMGVSQVRGGGTAVPSSGLSPYRGGGLDTFGYWDDEPEEDEGELEGGAVEAEEAEEGEEDEDMDALIGGAINEWGATDEPEEAEGEEDDGEELVGGRIPGLFAPEPSFTQGPETTRRNKERREAQERNKPYMPQVVRPGFDKRPGLDKIKPVRPVIPDGAPAGLPAKPRFAPTMLPEASIQPMTGRGKAKKAVKMSEAMEMGRHLGKHLHSLHGAGFYEDFSKGLSMPVLAQAETVPAGLAGSGKAMKGCAGKGKLQIIHGGAETGRYEGKGVVVGAGKKKRAPAGPSDGRRKRAEVVKRVMAEKGLKMIEASKYVKEHGLY